MSNIRETIRDVFPKKSVLILGDLVADQFLRGTISRVSREAPVFILRHENTETLGGGAANAVSNVCSLGAKGFLVGLVGDDANGRALMSTLERQGVNVDGVIRSTSFTTTTKLRVLASQSNARRQQVIRIDYEDDNNVNEDTLKELETNALALLSKMDALIISDYGYGVAEQFLCARLIDCATDQDIPVFIDSRSNLEDFKGATAATPNQEEVENLLESEYSAGKCTSLRERLGVEALLVTLGNQGMFQSVRGSEAEEFQVVGSKEPVDVTGAGDTVIATYALGVVSGLGYSVAAKVANHAGGVVVMKNGTASLTVDEILRSIKKHEPTLTDSKLHQTT